MRMIQAILAPERLQAVTALLADAEITKVLPAAEIEKAFDLKEQLRNVDAVFKRVFYLGA